MISINCYLMIVSVCHCTSMKNNMKNMIYKFKFQKFNGQNIQNHNGQNIQNNSENQSYRYSTIIFIYENTIT